MTAFRSATAIAAAAVALAACGGGGGGDGLSQEVAQGYAADAVTMPVSGTAGAETATSTLENALAATPAVTALAARPDATIEATASGSVACPGGGTVAWTNTAPTTGTLGNGRFDTGEIYAATYTACVTADGSTLDGNLTLTVNSRSDTSSGSTLDLTATTGSAGLASTNALGRYVSTGGWNHVRTSAATSSGGTQRTNHITSTGVTLASTIGSRQASYELRSLDWTIVKTFDANGALLTRSHQGSLSLAASTPRRPNATLQVTTQGTLTVSSDGLASAGSFSLVTGNATIACTYGNGNATLTLDLGNDGSIDRTWVLTRNGLDGEAG